MFTITKRELGGFLKSWRGYVFISIFTLIFSIFHFIYQGHDIHEIELLNMDGVYTFYILEQTLELLPLAFAVAIPLLTFDLFYNERSSGVGELLRSLPFSVRDMFAGKFHACEIMFVMAYALVNAVALLLGLYRNIEPMRIIIMTLSYLLVCNALLAINVFIAAVCKRRQVALSISYGVCILMVVLFLIGSKNVGVVANICSLVSVIGTFTPSLYGVLDLSAITLQITVRGVFVFLGYTYFKKDMVI